MIVFYPTPSRWSEDIRREAMGEAQYHANRQRQRVTVYHRARGNRFYFRLPGQTPPRWARRVTWFDPEKKS